MEKGCIITLSGISGAGKSHFIKSVLERLEGFEKLKAVTTRQQRKDEVDGIDKYFLSLEDFNKRYEQGEMCVVNNVFGNMYGYFKSDMDKTNVGINLVTELYYKEVEAFKNEYPNTISIYILPSDISQTLEQLKDRNTGYEEYQKRTSDIKKELDSFNEGIHNVFDIIISNNYDQESVDKFIELILQKISLYQNNSNSIIHSKIDDDTKEKVDCFAQKQGNRSVIYTSFDGDDMHFLHSICKTEIDRGNIPLNPETSLGYYVSTVSLGGKKRDVMMDCLTLEMMADKMSVYGKDNRPLSEGIIAEMMLWNSEKNSGLELINGVVQMETDQKITAMSSEELKKFIDSQDDILKYELHHNLLKFFEREQHQTSYIIANMENFKHIDWARSYCYSNGLCPISPQNILPLYLYNGDSTRYLEDRLELLRHSDNILLFIDRNNLSEELARLDKFSQAEIYYASEHLKKQIQLVGWDEALVPKYDPNNKWSLTTKEDIQVRKLLK